MSRDASEQVTPATDARPSQVSRRNAAHAHLAIGHVRAQLPPFDRAHPPPRDARIAAADFGAWLTGRFEQIWPLRHEAELVDAGEADFSSTTLVHRLAEAARRAAAGRAGEEAVLAFAYLHTLGVRPLDFMCCPGREHAFVVIGRTPPAAAREAQLARAKELGLTIPNAAGVLLRPEDWGAEAVVCDPHQGVVYTQPELLKSDHYDEYHPCESQLFAPPARAAELD
jgi:hypothetical protein